MNILAILFVVTLGVFAWRWHNQTAPPHTQPRASPPKTSARAPKTTPAPRSHGTGLALLTTGALLAGNALAAQPLRAWERSVPTTDATPAIQMPSERLAGKTAAPTRPAPTTAAQLPDPAELPRVGTELVKNGEPPHLRLRHEPFHNQWVANMPARN